ncbi:hypothetical protein [Streptomyces sp. 1222.5]|uniref:hypothetical protein n=1 Tax=Streptomyces sp. 1222.5 TaxID=1881026 RepID=UPI003EB90F5F
MALNVCGGCTTKFAVGLKRCPHCASTDFCEDDMPKITVHGGPSDATVDEEPEASGTAAEGEDTGQAVAEPEPQVESDAEGGEDVSAGTDSSTSSEKQSEKPEQSEKQDPSPARTTASRSAKARTVKGSTARSTGGAPESGSSATTSDK